MYYRGTFFHNDLEKYHINKLSTVRLVSINGKIIFGYFTVLMNAIELNILSKDEKVSGTSTKKYPAMLSYARIISCKFFLYDQSLQQRLSSCFAVNPK